MHVGILDVSPRERPAITGGCYLKIPTDYVFQLNNTPPGSVFLCLHKRLAICGDPL